MASSKLRARLPAWITTITPQLLYRWNILVVLLYVVQAVAIVVIGATRTFPVETSFRAVEPLASAATGQTVITGASHHLWDLNLAFTIAFLLGISAVVHLLVATVGRKRYEADLKKGRNVARWIDYALTTGVAVACVAVVGGVTELSVLLALIGFQAIASLCGLAQEMLSQGKPKANWLVYWVGVIAGFLPWLILAIYLGGAQLYDGTIPAATWWIFGTVLAFFLAVPVVQAICYRKKPLWKNYLQTERIYIVLSVAIKAVLVWQLFFGNLRP